MFAEFPLFVFTVLGGIAAGATLAAALFPLSDAKTRLRFDVACLALLALGGVALMFHLGHPERLLYAFSNPGAGITLEGYASVLFGVLLVVEVLLGWRKGECPRAVSLLAGIAGALLLAAMGFAYSQFVGIAGWGGPASFCLFFLGALGSGALLPVLFDGQLIANRSYVTCAVACQVVSACSFAAICAQFVGAGFSPILFVLGIVASAAAAVFTWRMKPEGSTPSPAVIFAVSVVALVLVRYAFYCV